MDATIIIVLVIIGIAAFFIIIHNRGQEHKANMVKEAKEQYDQALKSGNKQSALEAGRNYYKTLRDGVLSIYDEQAINNDLSAMQ